MTHTEHAEWKTTTHYDNGVKVTRPTAKKIAFDLGLKMAGATVMYGLGRGIGEALDYTPYLSEWIPQAVDYVSSIDVKGNLDGLVGLLGLLYGSSSSGTKTFKDDPTKLETMELSPIKLTFNK